MAGEALENEGNPETCSPEDLEALEAPQALAAVPDAVEEKRICTEGAQEVRYAAPLAERDPNTNQSCIRLQKDSTVGTCAGEHAKASRGLLSAKNLIFKLEERRSVEQELCSVRQKVARHSHQAEQAALATELAALKSFLSDKDEKLLTKDALVADLQRQLAASQAEAVTSRQDADRFRRTLEAKEAHCSQLDAQLTREKERNIREAASCARIKRQLASALQLSAKRESCFKKQQILRALDQQKQEQDAREHAAAAKAARLRQEADIVAAQREVAIARQATSDLLQEVARVNERACRTEEQLQRASAAHLTELVALRQLSKDEIHETEARCAAAIAVGERAAAHTRQALGAQVAAAQADAASWRSALEAARVEAESLAAEVRSLCAAADARAAESEGLRAACTARESELDGLRAECARLGAESQEARAKLLLVEEEKVVAAVVADATTRAALAAVEEEKEQCQRETDARWHERNQLVLDELAELQDRYRRLEGENERLCGQAELEEQARRALERELEEANQSLQTALARAEERLSEETERGHQLAASHAEQGAALLRQLSEVIERVQSLGSVFAATEERAQQLGAELVGAQARVERHVADVGRLEECWQHFASAARSTLAGTALRDADLRDPAVVEGLFACLEGERKELEGRVEEEARRRHVAEAAAAAENEEGRRRAAEAEQVRSGLQRQLETKAKLLESLEEGLKQQQLRADASLERLKAAHTRSLAALAEAKAEADAALLARDRVIASLADEMRCQRAEVEKAARAWRDAEAAANRLQGKVAAARQESAGAATELAAALQAVQAKDRALAELAAKGAEERATLASEVARLQAAVGEAAAEARERGEEAEKQRELCEALREEAAAAARAAAVEKERATALQGELGRAELALQSRLRENQAEQQNWGTQLQGLQQREAALRANLIKAEREVQLLGDECDDMRDMLRTVAEAFQYHGEAIFVLRGMKRLATTIRERIESKDVVSEVVTSPGISPLPARAPGPS